MKLKINFRFFACLMLVFAMLLSTGCSSLSAKDYEALRQDHSTDNRSLWFDGAAEQACCDALFGDERFADAVLFLDNRPYIEKSLAERFEQAEQPAQPLWPIYTKEGREYTALADAAFTRKMLVQFEEDGAVRLFRDQTQWNSFEGMPQEGAAAHIRLEDIMADFDCSGRFTHENLAKLRFFARYLGRRSQGFYIAWIPVYANPERGITNDISSDFCFYNGDFLFTLDVMTACGGRLGLHGLTHQSGSQISADGYEFGKENKYSEKELTDRFTQAAQVCRAIGHDYWFFEFSHYDATKKQKKIAEKYFEAVYQQSPYTKNYGHIEERQISGLCCKWVPTPADCVEHPYDRDGILQRLKETLQENKVQSLFMHPSMDYDRIWIAGSGEDRAFGYDEQGGILASILRQLAEDGFVFGYF